MSMYKVYDDAELKSNLYFIWVVDLLTKEFIGW